MREPSGPDVISLMRGVSGNGGGGTLRDWQIEDWHDEHVAVVREGAVSFLRLSAETKGHLIIKTPIELEPEWRSLRFSARIRVTKLRKGDAGWKSARIEPRLAGNRPIDFDETPQWQPVAVEWSVPADAESFELLVGFWESAGVFDLADMALEPVLGPRPAPPAREEAESAGPPIAARTDAAIDPSGLADPYLRGLVEETRALKPLRILTLTPTDENLKVFDFQDVGGGASRTDVDVTGQSFARAMRIVTEKKKEEWRTHTQWWIPGLRLRRGDVVYVTATARFLGARDGKGSGRGRLYASHASGRGGNEGGHALYGGDFDIRGEWHRVHLPMTVTHDFGADDRLKLMFTFGHENQEIEFGGIAALLYPAGTNKAALPHDELPLAYPGREANASWRAAAQKRIEEHRKADLTVVVVDADGRPAVGAEVNVELVRHAYKFATNPPGLIVPGSNVKPWNDDFARVINAPADVKRKALEAFERHFNYANTGMTWAVWEGADQRISREDLMALARWCKEVGTPIDCVQVVYPGPEFLSPHIKGAFDQKRADEVAAAIKAHIFQQCEALAPFGHESFQIANELEGRPAYTDLMGKEAVLDWFRWADEARRKYNPDLKLMTNTPSSPERARTPARSRDAFRSWLSENKPPEGEWYYEFVTWLKKNVPIDFFGFQNHAGIGWSGPEATLRGLDWFATIGLPIEITEFEVCLQNPDDPRQREYQADYVRDFYTAVFSHPATRGITTQNFWQLDAWQYEGGSCFWDRDMNILPHGEAFLDLVWRRWKTVAEGTTGRNGICRVRGFLGEYAVRVTVGGSVHAVRAALGKGGSRVQVKLGRSAVGK